MGKFRDRVDIGRFLKDCASGPAAKAHHGLNIFDMAGLLLVWSTGDLKERDELDEAWCRAAVEDALAQERNPIPSAGDLWDQLSEVTQRAFAPVILPGVSLPAKPAEVERRVEEDGIIIIGPEA